jgi:hypothetical protein
MSYPQGHIVKVQITHDDGTVKTLTGDRAEEGNVVCDTEAEHGPPEAGESFLECISLWCTCGQNLIDNNQVETGS